MIFYKKLTAFLLTAFMLFAAAGPAVAAVVPAAAESMQEAAAARAEGMVFHDFDKAPEAPMPLDFDEVMLPLSAEWLSLIDHEAPATFSQVSYELVDGVVELDSDADAAASTAIRGIASGDMRRNGVKEQRFSPNRILRDGGGFIDKQVLESAAPGAIKPGAVVMDRATGTAFKVIADTGEFDEGAYTADPELSALVEPFRDAYFLARPDISEVLKDFNLGGETGETITLTYGNITGFAEGIEDCLVLPDGRRISNPSGDPAQSYDPPHYVRLGASTGGQASNDPYWPENLSASDHKWRSSGSWVNLSFNNTPLKGYTDSNNGVYVNVSGGFRITKPDLDAWYKCNGGYRMALTLEEESFFSVTLKMELKERIRIPFFTVGIDIEKVGTIGASLVLVVEVDGSFRVDFYASEYISVTFGIRGGTFFYIPTSVKPFIDWEMDTEADCKINGKINAAIKLGPEMGISIAGFELIGAGAYIGAGVAVESLQQALMLELKVYGLLEVYASIIGIRKNIIAMHPTLLRRTQKDTMGYKVSIDECYTLPGRVGGVLWKEAMPGNPKAVNGFVPCTDVIYYRLKAKTGQPRSPALEMQYATETDTQYFPANGWMMLGTLTGTGKSWQFSTFKDGVFYLGDGLDPRSRLWHSNQPGANPTINYHFGSVGDAGIRWEEVFPNPWGINGIRELVVEFWTPQTYGQTGGPEIRFESEPIKMHTPFSQVTIFEADYFNHYLTGQINPQQFRDWAAYSDSVDYLYRSVMPPPGITITIQPAKLDAVTNEFEVISTSPYSVAFVTTDAKGYFDTRIASDTINTLWRNVKQSNNYWIDSKGKKVVNGRFAVDYFLNPRDAVFYFSYDLKNNLSYNYKASNLVKFTPTMAPLFYRREVYPVPGSQEKVERNDGTIRDIMQYDEYIWIMNPNGERTITEEEFFHVAQRYSKVDPLYEEELTQATGLDESIWMNASMGGAKLYSYVEDGASTTVFARRVKAYWTWQDHPNPARITGANSLRLTPVDDSYEIDTQYIEYQQIDTPDGVAIQIEAEGDQLAYYIKDELPPGTTISPYSGLIAGFPPGVTIDKRTGVLRVPGGLGTWESKAYVFTMGVVQEGNANGHDPAPPHEIRYNLTIYADPRVEPPKPPIIDRDKTYPETRGATGFNFSVEEGDSFTADIDAEGDEPITWSLKPVNGNPIPAFVSIDPESGVLAAANAVAGTYNLVVVATNDAGTDEVDCYLNVFPVDWLDEPPTPTVPVISFNAARYSAEPGASFYTSYYLDGAEPLTVTVSAADASGAAVSGFSITKLDPAAYAPIVYAPTNLAPGEYTVTAVAKNDAGEASASFIFEVLGAAEAPPVITLDGDYFRTMVGTVFRASYTLSGGAATAFNITAVNQSGTPVTTVGHSEYNQTIVVPGTVPPGLYTVTFTASNNAGESSASFVLEVQEPTPPVITSPTPPYEDRWYITTMTRGTDYALPFVATGSEPLTWSLELNRNANIIVPVPDEASISNEGILTISGDIAVGSYSFVVHVANDIGFDTMTFSITVEANWRSREIIRPDPIRPPNLTPQSSQAPGGSALSIKPLSASSQPIVLLPLASQPAYEAGLHEIADKAPAIEWQYADVLTDEDANRQSLKFRAATQLTEIQWQGVMHDTRSKQDSTDIFSLINASLIGAMLPPPPNAGAIDWIDKKDCYTNDRFTVNGARDYVFWTTAIKVQLNRRQPYTGFYGTGEVLGRDTASWTQEKYHSKQNLMMLTTEGGWDFGDEMETETPPNLPRSGSLAAFDSTFLEDFTRGFGAKAGAYYDDFLDAVLGTGDETGDGDSGGYGEDTLTGLDSGSQTPGGLVVESTVLHYGLTVDAITRQKGGQHMVWLGDGAGTVVVEDYFSALRENQQAGISFVQDGAAITFAGADIRGGDFGDADFGYTPGSLYAPEIVEAAGLSDAQYFTYSFAYHGDLPGTATFGITTDMAEGATVNVYRFDPETNTFTRIATNLKVGTDGVVTYRNDSMSDYLITTGTVAGAQRQGGTGSLPLYAAVGAAVVLLGAGIAVLFIRRKKRQEG